MHEKIASELNEGQTSGLNYKTGLVKCRCEIVVDGNVVFSY